MTFPPRRTIGVSAVTIIAVTALAVAACTQSATPTTAAVPASAAPTVTGDTVAFPAASPQLAYVKTSPATVAGARTLDLYGRLAWDEDRTVRVWSPLAGRARAVSATVGATVAAGDLLLTMASPDFDQAEADLRSAVTNADLANRAYDRTNALYAHGAAATKDVEAAAASRDLADSERRRAGAKVALYGAPIGDDHLFALRSPIAGTVVDREVVPGQEVRSDAALANIPQVAVPAFTISDPDRLWVWIDLPEAELSAVKTGDHFTVTCRGLPGRTFTGTIDLISQSLDPVTRMAAARGAVANPDRALRAEMYVSCQVMATAGIDASGRLQVPSAAVFLDGERTCVFVQSGPTRFQCREITASDESAGSTTVTKGIAAGDAVVSEGALLLDGLLHGGGG